MTDAMDVGILQGEAVDESVTQVAEVDCVCVLDGDCLDERIADVGERLS